jgi:hypothetical protein
MLRLALLERRMQVDGAHHMRSPDEDYDALTIAGARPPVNLRVKSRQGLFIIGENC